MSGRGTIVRGIYLAFALLVWGGAAALLVAPQAAAFVVLSGVTGLFATRLVIGVVEYRRTMRRPWPDVEPLEDDDEW